MRHLIKKWNTLRNQILIIFVVVMVVVFSFASIMTFHVVSSLLQDNAERQIHQTTVQASGRMEALYEQVEFLSNQVATNNYVQGTLLNERNGISADFDQRQYLMQVVDSFLAFTQGIESFELYKSNGERLLPLNQGTLYSVLDRKWVEKADELKGQMIFAGQDPLDENYYLAIKQVTLLERWFSPGGYLVARIKESYLNVDESLDLGEYLLVVDQNSTVLASNYDGDVESILENSSNTMEIDNEEYMVVDHYSDITEWTTMILTPVSTVTKDVALLRNVLVVIGMIGCIFFFLLTYPLSSMITRPIEKLTETMRFGSLGTLKESPQIASTKEINELTNTYNQMVTAMNHLIEVVYEKELIRSKTELKALQAQINPHFLFNTLEALYWDLVEKGEDELSDFVLDMADLFRYTITNSKKDDWVTLKDEMDHVERYMRIMQIRFEDRMAWKVNVPEGYEAVPVPKLVIQPIVENAILHGVGNRVGEGMIEISVTPEHTDNQNEPGLIRIDVYDNGAGMEEEKLSEVLEKLEKEDAATKSKHGLALVNVKQRLKLSYGDETHTGIRIRSEKGKGTCVSIRLPLKGEH